MPKLDQTPHIIGVACGWGAQIRETEKGPEAILNANCMKSYYRDHLSDFIQAEPRAHKKDIALGEESLPIITDVCTRLANVTAKTIREDYFPVIFGGDHSVAIGTWSGIIQALDAYEDFGLIWVDAHMDAHTFETSPSMAIHGMPLAVLLGHGEEALRTIGGKSPKINPKHLCLVGTRSYEEDEKALLEELDVRVIYIKEVLERGFENAMKEAISIASQASKGYGLSIDLDVICPREAPGVGSPEEHGIPSKDIVAVLKKLGNDERLKAIEIPEYNPDLDIDNKTLQIACDFIHALMPPNK